MPDKLNTRAYSLLEIKALDESKREITGIATTPEPDRVGDVVEPLGAKFAAELPLLWQHQHDKPVGTAKFGKPTKTGIPFTASLPVIDEPGALKDLVDMAWQSVKAKLVRGVSIGFRAIEYSFIENGGVRFSETEIFELSLVTIPANASASIHSIKSIDTALRAASGNEAQGDEEAGRKPVSPGVSGTKKQPATGGFFYAPTKEKGMNIKDQLVNARAKLAETEKSMQEIMGKATGEGRTLNAEEAEEFDGHESAVGDIKKHIERLEGMEKNMTFTQVKGDNDDDATASRAPAIVSKAIKMKEEPGLMFARHALCMYAAKNNVGMAAQLAADHYGEKSPVAQVLKGLGGRSLESVLKANVAAATTSDATWAGPLLAYNNYSQDFVEFLRPRTILGQFGLGNIPAAKRIPFNVHIKGQTSGGVGYWVGQGAPKPVTKFDFNDVYFGWFKVAGISVATDEMIRFSDPAIEVLIRDGLVEAGAERMNTDFIDPTFAGLANVSPASILYGLTPIVSSGTDADAVRADLMALQAEADDANNPLTTMVYLMHPKTAAGLGNMYNPLGQREFPNISRNGGDVGGVPVITSGYVPYDSSGGVVAMVNAADLWYADDGQATVDMSNQASIQMLDNPTNNSASATATSLVSMFQTDSTAFRMHRFANWKRRRESSFAYLTGVNWGAA
jgi:HK97 family phage major capsid protein/HK97 family phage prohead protease